MLGYLFYLFYLFYLGERGATDLEYATDPGNPDDRLRLRHDKAMTPQALAATFKQGETA